MTETETLDDKLRNITPYMKRVDYLEDDVRQVRMKAEKRAFEFSEELEAKIDQQTCEKTILKFSEDMMSGMLDKLDTEQKRNMTLQD